MIHGSWLSICKRCQQLKSLKVTYLAVGDMMAAAPSCCASKQSPTSFATTLATCPFFLLSSGRSIIIFIPYPSHHPSLSYVLCASTSSPNCAPRHSVRTHHGDLLSILIGSIATECLAFLFASSKYVSTLSQLQHQEHDIGHSIDICSSPPDTALFRVFLQHFLDPSFPLDTGRIHILDGHFLSPETHLLRYATILLSNPEHNHLSLYTYLLQNPCLTPSEYYQLSFFSSSQTYTSSSSYLQGLGVDRMREWEWHKPLPSFSRSVEKSLVSISWILLVSCYALNISCLTVLEVSDMSCVLNLSLRMR